MNTKGVSKRKQIRKGGAMAKRTSPFYRTLLSALASPFVSMKQKVHDLFLPSIELEPWPTQPLTLEPKDPEPKAVAPKNTKWVLAETSDNDDNNKNVVLVQVEYFPDTYVADLTKKPRKQLQNFTVEGEDPNLRITHYPSNRLH